MRAVFDYFICIVVKMTRAYFEWLRDIGSNSLLREFGVSNCAIDFQSTWTNSNLSCCG